MMEQPIKKYEKEQAKMAHETTILKMTDEMMDKNLIRLSADQPIFLIQEIEPRQEEN